MVVLRKIVAENPDAVFIWRSSIESVQDLTANRVRAVGRTVTRDLFEISDGSSETDRFVIKPNIAGGPREGEKLGVAKPHPGESTLVDYVGGMLETFKTLGVSGKQFTITEGRSNLDLEPTLIHNGYIRLGEETGATVINNSKDPYQKDELNWMYLDKGVVTERMPIVRPVNDPDTRLINIAKMKTHGLAITTLSVKNLQGLVAFKYKHYCHELETVEKYDPEIRNSFRSDLQGILEPGFQRHNAEIPRWDMRDELYANRACDTLLAVKPMISMVEGIVGRCGTGYRRASDMVTNMIVAGINPVHVDTVTTYLMGHNPANLNYLKVANERGFGTNDPNKIKVFIWTDGNPVLCEDLSSLERLGLGVYYRGDTSKLEFV